MIFPLLRRRPRQNTISSLYGTIVAQARLPRFYREYEVPDTVNGRFELLVMHVVLVILRLSEDPKGRGLGQDLFDYFCSDMDHNLREMGVGDLSVPKQMRGVGQAYYGRASTYQYALEAQDASLLAEAVARNIYGGEAADWPPASRLATYMRQVAHVLAAQPTADLMTGRVALPNPGVTFPAEDKASLPEG